MSFSLKTSVSKTLLLLGLSLISFNNTQAQHMRQFSMIATPDNAELKQVTRQRVEESGIDPQSLKQAVEKVAQAWSQKDLSNILAADYQQTDRLQESMLFEVPKDAQIQIESIRNIAVIGQQTRQNQSVLTVSATLQTRIEFHDATNGFISVPGTNELVLELIEINE